MFVCEKPKKFDTNMWTKRQCGITLSSPMNQSSVYIAAAENESTVSAVRDT